MEVIQVSLLVIAQGVSAVTSKVTLPAAAVGVRLEGDALNVRIVGQVASFIISVALLHPAAFLLIVVLVGVAVPLIKRIKPQHEDNRLLSITVRRPPILVIAPKPEIVVRTSCDEI